MKLVLPVSVALVLIAVTTYYQGFWSERWAQDELAAQLKTASDRVAEVPNFVGDWKGEPQEANEDQLRVARVTAHQSNEFFNLRTGARVSSFIVCGKPRHVAIHTPDDCYVAAGFSMLDQPERVEIETEDGTAEFYTTVFKKVENGNHVQLRVFWAWNRDGQWEAPQYPRWAYAWGPALYKMYVMAPVNNTDDLVVSEDHPGVMFIKSMVPEANAALFASEPAEAEATAEVPAATASPGAAG